MTLGFLYGMLCIVKEGDIMENVNTYDVIFDVDLFDNILDGFKSRYACYWDRYCFNRRVINFLRSIENEKEAKSQD